LPLSDTIVPRHFRSDLEDLIFSHKRTLLQHVLRLSIELRVHRKQLSVGIDPQKVESPLSAVIQHIHLLNLSTHRG
jgi:hypothetical protein